MRIDIATLFVEMCEAVASESIVGRARRAGKIEIYTHQIRDYTLDRHRRVDDTPYGGGMGMLLQADPIFLCYEEIRRQIGVRPHTIFLSPQGQPFCQKNAVELSQRSHLLLLCGHYEGVDQRVLDEIVDEEISLGDYVLTGGELGALVITDAVARLCDGVLSQEVCFTDESHYNGLLEYPQYTRPPVWHGREVPPVLLSGNHRQIELWRRQQSLEATWRKRPDLLASAPLTKADRAYLQSLRERERERAQKEAQEQERNFSTVELGE